MNVLNGLSVRGPDLGELAGRLKMPPQRMFEAVVSQVQAFEQSLTAGEDVGVMLTTLGAGLVIHVRNLAHSQEAIFIAGVDEDGREVELIQHFTQISILLTRVKAQNPEEPRRQIGFL